MFSQTKNTLWMNGVTKPPEFVYGIAMVSWLTDQMVKKSNELLKECSEDEGFNETMKELQRSPEEWKESVRANAMLETITEYYILTPRKH